MYLKDAAFLLMFVRFQMGFEVGFLDEGQFVETGTLFFTQPFLMSMLFFNFVSQRFHVTSFFLLLLSLNDKGFAFFCQ